MSNRTIISPDTEPAIVVSGANAASASAPAGAPSDAEARQWVRPGMWREIGSIVLFLTGIFTILCLVSPSGDRSLVGPAGLTIREALHFVLGRFVVWAVPVGLVATAVLVFCSKVIPRLGARVAGMVGLVLSVCALLGLSGADDASMRAETFAMAGALGTFLTDAEGLGLAWQLGALGSVLFFSGLALISLLLATDVLLGPIVAQTGAVWGEWMERRRLARQARQAEKQSNLWRSRLFGPSTPAPGIAPATGSATQVFAADPNGNPAAPGMSEAQGVSNAQPGPAAFPEQPARRSRWSIFGGRGSGSASANPLDPASRSLRAGAPGASAADAMTFGLPGAQSAAQNAQPGAEVGILDEVVDDPALETAAQPTIIDGFSPLPTAASANAAASGSLWETDEPAGITSPNGATASSGAQIGLAGIQPGSVCAAATGAAGTPRAAAASKMGLPAPIAAPASGVPSQGAIPAAASDGEPTPAEARMLARAASASASAAAASSEAKSASSHSGDDPGESIDDPLFESADVAKRLGITAATAQNTDGSAPSSAASASAQSGGNGNSGGAGGAASSTAAGATASKSKEPVNYSAYRLPAVELLDDPPRVDSRMSREELLEISQTLEKTLCDFGIDAKVIQVTQGPVVTRFELKPAAGVKVSRITALEQDISMALRATNPVRIIAPIPGKAAVGIEVPNRRRAGVYLKELISCDDFWSHKSPLAFALGKTIEGDPSFCDLSKMPHLLIAGATGTGKSVCINAIICSILYRMKPDRVRFLFVDPKRVELALYQDIPHLIAPVVCDPKRAAGALAWAVDQMEQRYDKLVEMGVRNIESYNAIAEDPSKSRRAQGRLVNYMQHMVIVLDELADLMVVAKADVEESIQRLAQMARAVGIHLIVATQRPSVNVITGVIKANFPARIAFQVSSKADSRVILDVNGAETLLGRGDMLFHPGGAPKPSRIQGCFVSEAEVDRLVECIKQQAGPNYQVEEFQPLRDDKGRPLTRGGEGGPSLFDNDDEDWGDEGSGYDGEEDGGAGAGRRGTNQVMGSIGAGGEFVPHAGGSAWAGDDEIDEALVRAAARLVLESRKASVSLLQRRLKVGFARAGRLMDMLEEIGIVGPFQGSKPRDILVNPDDYLARMDAHETQTNATSAASAAASARD